MLDGWTPAEKEELDDLVRHMLHSRRARFKRSMKGFLQYVRRREFTYWSCIEFLIMGFCSTRIVRNRLRYLDHAIRRSLGAFPNRLDISGFETKLHYQYRR